MFILLCYYIFDWIHRSQVHVIFIRPSGIPCADVLHQFLCFFVWRCDESSEFFKPVLEKLLIWLWNHQIALVCTQHHSLGVCFFVIGPFKICAIMRMEKHEYSRHFAISIEYHLTWSLCDVDNPLESFDWKIRDVHVNASVFDYDCKSNKVWFHLCTYLDLSVLEIVVDLLIEFRPDVLSSVLIIEFPYLKIVLDCRSSNVLKAQSVRNFRVLDAWVPIKPDDFRKLIPLFACCVYCAPFDVLKQIILVILEYQMPSNEWIWIDVISFSLFSRPLKQLINFFLQRHAGHITHWSGWCLHIS